jgi:hypothetical protein
MVGHNSSRNRSVVSSTKLPKPGWALAGVAVNLTSNNVGCDPRDRHSERCSCMPYVAGTCWVDERWAHRKATWQEVGYGTASQEQPPKSALADTVWPPLGIPTLVIELFPWYCMSARVPVPHALPLLPTFILVSSVILRRQLQSRRHFGRNCKIPAKPKVPG